MRLNRIAEVLAFQFDYVIYCFRDTELQAHGIDSPEDNEIKVVCYFSALYTDTVGRLH